MKVCTSGNPGTSFNMFVTWQQFVVVLLTVLVRQGSHVECFDFNDYPDPQINLNLCGNENQKTWICDPGLTFSTSQYQTINGLLVDIQSGIKCACGQVSCERSFVVSVAFVESIPTYGTKTQVEVTQDFADFLRRDSWNKHGDCNENIVIVYNKQSNIIVVAVGPAARETLQDECSGNVLDETRAKLKQTGDAFVALSFMIGEFRKYLGGSAICRSRPNAGGKLDLIYIAWIVLGLVAIIGIIILIICCFRRCYGPQDRRAPEKKKNRFNSEQVARHEAGVFGLSRRKGIDGPAKRKNSALTKAVHPYSNPPVLQNPPSLLPNAANRHPNGQSHAIPNGQPRGIVNGQPHGIPNGGPYGVQHEGPQVLQNGGSHVAYPSDIKITQHDGGITVLELGDEPLAVPSQQQPVNQQRAVGFVPTNNVTQQNAQPYINQQQQQGFVQQPAFAQAPNAQFQNPALQNFPHNPGYQNAPSQVQGGAPPAISNAASVNYTTLDLSPPRQLGQPPQMTQIDPPSLTLSSGSADTAASAAQATVASYSNPAHNLPPGIFGNNAGNPPGQVQPTGNMNPSARPRHNHGTVRDFNPDADAEMAFGDDDF